MTRQLKKTITQIIYLGEKAEANCKNHYADCLMKTCITFHLYSGSTLNHLCNEGLLHGALICLASK